MLCGPTRTLRTNKESKDARVHCAVLNVRPDTLHMTPPDPRPPQGQQRYEKQEGPDTRATVPTTPGSLPGDGPLSQDPTACLQPANP
jgi:hypothetical protein